MKFNQLFLFAILLTSCATPYQPLSFSGGYNSVALDSNIFKVSFRGNGDTSGERAEDFALLRSAEITIKNGYKYFSIMDKNNSTDYSSFTTPANTITTANSYGYGGVTSFQANSTTYGGQNFLISKPSATNVIKCFKEKPEGQDLIFDAAFLIKSIKSKYQLN